MRYDSFCMSAAVEELRGGFTEGWVDQIYQPDPLTVYLAFTGAGPRRYWLFSSDARWARSHAAPSRGPSRDTPLGFCMLLRKHLNGAYLARVEQVRFDRILRLEFRRGPETRTLVHEVMGKHSNLLLLDEEETILGAAKHVPPSQSRVRTVFPGLPYQHLPDSRPDPRQLSLEQLREVLQGVETPDGLTQALSGWGTFAAREAFAHTGAGNLAAAVAEMMARVRQRDYEPAVLRNEAGERSGVWAFPSTQQGWQRSERAEGMSEACERFYRHLEENAATEALRKSVQAVLNRALKTARLQLSEAEDALNGLDRAELLKIKGELLTAAGGQVERDATAIELPNWYDPEQRPLRIELDPELDARENAERYFHRYRRATASAEAALERIPELTGQVEALEALVREAGETAEERLRLLIDEAKAVAPRLVSATPQQSGPRPDGKAPESEFPSGVRIKRVPCRGWDIYYGENATSNDYLTTKFARPNDLWLHARAVTGAHVIVRGVNTLDRLPPEVLREAARLAAAHSDAKHSSVVPVDYTFRRYVRKPRGSAPGRVTLTGEKTLDVNPAERGED